MRDATDCGKTRSARREAGFAMPARCTHRRAASGQALLILVVMLSVATMLLVYGSTTEIERAIKADARARGALEQARQALIGRAIADANRPGSLPCPDNDDDGSADLFSGSACPSYIGRLPWRTLGVGDLRDHHGERLWYALSPAFRDHPAAPALNTDTRGSLAVYSNSDATLLAGEAIAIVFAPGMAVGTQVRDDTVELCAATGKAVSRRRCVSNYLEAAGGMNNASAGGPFIAAPSAGGYNDRLVAILASDLMPLVERRVAIELRSALLAYRATSACACYPWADVAGSGDSQIGANRGRLPIRKVEPQGWPANALPPYVVSNDWARFFYYSAARIALDAHGAACSTCSADTLEVDGAPEHDVILISTGFAASPRKGSAPLAYLDDPENIDDDDRYVTPRASTPDRDRLFAILGSGAGCAANARALIDTAPCVAPIAGIAPVCTAAAAALAKCSCASAAASLLRAPCAAAPGSPSCEPAMNQLRRCAL